MTSVAAMNAAETIAAAIQKLEELKAASTPGTWAWWNLARVDQGWDDNGPNLVVYGDWRTCEKTWCTWTEPDAAHRGTPRQPGHEHRERTSVIDSYGYDAWGINVKDADADLIVTLHRTIDAQLAILFGVGNGQKLWSVALLARAILGGAS